jgi:hypothetical protein
MAKGQRHRADDAVLLSDGGGLTRELDIASVEMLQYHADIGLRNFAEQCRRWQAMAEVELEPRLNIRRTIHDACNLACKFQHLRPKEG